MEREREIGAEAIVEEREAEQETRMYGFEKLGDCKQNEYRDIHVHLYCI